MASRSYRKRRHLLPYEQWGHPSVTDQLVSLMRSEDVRHPESTYLSSRQFGMTMPRGSQAPGVAMCGGGCGRKAQTAWDHPWCGAPACHPNNTDT